MSEDDSDSIGEQRGVECEVEGTVWPFEQPQIERAAQIPEQLNAPDRVYGGTHLGRASERPFRYDKISLPLEQKSLEGLEVTAEGIERIRAHLGHLDPYIGNDRMLDRLDRILAGELPFTEYDARFYSHELRESERFEAAGWPDGRPTDDDEFDRLWNDEHTATLEEFGFHEHEQRLYHPEVDDDTS